MHVSVRSRRSHQFASLLRHPFVRRPMLATTQPILLSQAFFSERIPTVRPSVPPFSYSFRSGSESARATASRERVSRIRLITLSVDMRCFLVENPGAVLADFVRWYSPTNWCGGSERSEQQHRAQDSDETVGNNADAVDQGDEVLPETCSDVIRDTVHALVIELVDLAVHRSAGGALAPTASAATATGNGSRVDAGAGSSTMGQKATSVDPVDEAAPVSAGGSCRLDWNDQGKVSWRPASASPTASPSSSPSSISEFLPPRPAVAAASTAGYAACGSTSADPTVPAVDVAATGYTSAAGTPEDISGIDEEEGQEWMKAWLEAESTVAVAEDMGKTEGNVDGSGVPHGSEKRLFNPAQVRTKLLHAKLSRGFWS